MIQKNSFDKKPHSHFLDPDQDYIFYTDDSKNSWSGVLTQKKVLKINSEETISLLLITYLSGLFVGSQKNWVNMMKEAYVINMTFKKVSYYLYDAKVTIKCELCTPVLVPYCSYIGLKSKYKRGTEMASISHLTFAHIKGRANMLADCISRLISIGFYNVSDPKEERNQ